MRIQEIRLLQQQGQNLCESVCSDLTSEQRYIVEGIYKHFEPLFEVQLKPQQISQLFGEIEKNASAAGSNRTAIGQGVDAVGVVNDTINKVGQWLQNTTPVQAFDQKFEQLKSKIGQKYPELDKQLTAMGTWAKENPGKTAAVIGVLTTIASLAGGPAGGAIAGQVLRGVTELLKGEKLSTAVGKGLKTAALGWMAGKTMDAIGSAIKQMAVDLDMIPLYHGSNYYKEVVGIPGARSTYEVGEIIGTRSEVNQFQDMFSQASELWETNQYDQARDLFNQAYAFADKVTKATMAATGEDYSKPAANLANILKGLSAAAEGAAAGATAYDKQGQPVTGQATQQQPTSEGRATNVKQIFENIELVEGLWDSVKTKLKQTAGAAAQKVQQVGHNITTKVTADKLYSAWQAAGSPNDSVKLAQFLKQQGVDDTIVSMVFKKMRLPLTDPTSSTKISVKQINSTIKTFKLKDLQRLQQIVDAELSKRTSKP